MLTIDQKLQTEACRNYSYDIVEAIQVIGGTNVQFAHDPKTGRVVVIEINQANVALFSAGLEGDRLSHRPYVSSQSWPGGLTMDEIPY